MARKRLNRQSGNSSGIHVRGQGAAKAVKADAIWKAKPLEGLAEGQVRSLSRQRLARVTAREDEIRRAGGLAVVVGPPGLVEVDLLPKTSIGGDAASRTSFRGASCIRHMRGVEGLKGQVQRLGDPGAREAHDRPEEAVSRRRSRIHEGLELLRAEYESLASTSELGHGSKGLGA